MFFDRLKQLCDEKGISTYKAATEIGLNRAAANKWKSGSIPNGQTLTKLADYFGVTTDYLLGEEIEKAPTLTKKDERDIAKDLELIMSNLEGADGLMFDGNPMSDEARESMRAAIEIGLKTVKILNKETYTPKKHKKG